MLRALRWALAWAALILALCLMPGQALPAWHWADLLSVDKLVHASLFAVLALLVLRGLLRTGPPFPRRTAAALALCAAYGGALELMQMFPALGRRGDWGDAAANAIGVAAGWAWHRWLRHRVRNGAMAASD